MTNFGNLLAGLNPIGSFTASSTPIFSLASLIDAFLSAPLPDSFVSQFKNTPQLLKYLKSSGISTEQNLVNIMKNPMSLTVSTTTVPTGLFTVDVSGVPVKTYVTSDASSSISELVKVPRGTSIDIRLIPAVKGNVEGIFQKKIVSFVSASHNYDLSLTVPDSIGRYVLTTSASPLSLIIQVIANAPPASRNSPAASPPLKAFRGLSGWITSVF